MKAGLTSGEVARQAAVNVQTVRYYERRKLLSQPPRTEGGFRLYPAQVVGQVRFIKKAQGLGFTLEEIHELLRLNGSGGRCSDVREHLESKVVAVDRKIAELQILRGALVSLAKTCRETTRVCPVLAELDWK